MIPTPEIQALRDRAAIAAAPLPYQQARLLPKLRRDRPLRFRVVELDNGVLWKLCLELDAAGAVKPLSVQAIHREVCRQWNRGLARWPAAQIVELCDVVLERRERERGQQPSGILDIMTKFPFRASDMANSVIRDARNIRTAMMNHRTSPGTITHLEDKLMALPFVDAATVESNPTLVTDSEGIPPKSVRVTLAPETIDNNEIFEIASIIHGKLPVGVATCGEFEVSLWNHIIAWDWSNSEFIGLLDAMRLFKRQSKS